MAQSAEYPDLKWVAPKSWTNTNRTSVQLIVIHTTQGSYHHQSAEDGAAYDARRTDGVSTHYFHDDNSTVQCVRTEDKAHHARTQGNNRGIGHELCGRAEWDDEWSNTYATAMLRLCARQAARDARKWGIPVKHLTVAQVDAGNKGFCGHNDVTKAFPEDGGDHTDPGPNFPWSTFLDMVRAELEDMDMPSVEEIWAHQLEDPYDTNNPPRKLSAGSWLRYVPSDGDVAAVKAEVKAVGVDVDKVSADLGEVQAQLTAQTETIAKQGADIAQILALLTPPTS